MGEVATLPLQEPRQLYSWWWDSHISPKNSKWLQENLTDIDSKVKMMIKLIEEDADSFSRRAEMYYEKRPELMKLVEDFYRAYRALAERYDHATVELRQAHQVMAGAHLDAHFSPDPNLPPEGDTEDERYDHAIVELRQAHQVMAGTDPDAHFPPDPNLSPEGDMEDGVRVLKEAVELLTAERDALLIEKAALEVGTAVHEAEVRRLKDKCTELEKTVFLGGKGDMEDLLSVQAQCLEEQRVLSSEIRSGIPALGKWGADIKAEIGYLKKESSESLRNLLDENLNLRRENEDAVVAASINESRVLNLLEEIRRERDAVRLDLEGVEKLLECSEATAPGRARAEQIQAITVNLVRLLDRVRMYLDTERRKLLSFVLLCGARSAAVEEEARRLRQLVSEADRTNLALTAECRRHAEAARVSGELIAELEGERLVQEAEVEFFSGENSRLAAGIGEISVIFENLYGADGPRLGDTLSWVRNSVVRAVGERERLAVENSVLSVLLEGLAVSGAEVCLELERENDGFALEVLNLGGMCVMLEDFENERVETWAGRYREMEEAWEVEAAGFYFHLQESAVWELVFEHTVSELELRSRRFENECRSNLAEAEKWRVRVRELEVTAALMVTAMDSLDRDIMSLEDRPQEGLGDGAGEGRGGERGWGDVEKMRRRVKAAGEEMVRMREEQKRRSKKLETAVKVIENLRSNKHPKRGPLKPVGESGPHRGGPPDRKAVGVKDIILDRASQEPLLVGLWDEAGGECGGGAASWTLSCSSPGSSSSAGSNTELHQTSHTSLVHPCTLPLVGTRLHQTNIMNKNMKNKKHKKGLCSCLSPC